MAAGRSNALFNIFLALAGVTALVVSLSFLLPKRTRFEIAREAEAAEATPAARNVAVDRTPAPARPVASPANGAEAVAPATKPSADPRVDQVRTALHGGLLENAPNRVEAAEGAKIVRAIAESVTAQGDVVRLARSMSADPAMAELLRPIAEEWKTSEDPAVRARGLLFLAALDPQKTASLWQAAVDGERDERVRAALLEGAPLAGNAAADAPVVNALLGVAARDGSEAVRAAAVRGLPAGLGAEPTRQLAAAFGRERAKDVRVEMLAVLGRLRTDDPTVVATLEATAFDAAEDLGVRREAFSALIRSSNEHPGLLSEEKLARVEETLGKLGRN